MKKSVLAAKGSDKNINSIIKGIIKNKKKSTRRDDKLVVKCCCDC